jgi:hypothetical protein
VKHVFQESMLPNQLRARVKIAQVDFILRIRVLVVVTLVLEVTFHYQVHQSACNAQRGRIHFLLKHFANRVPLENT